MNVRHSLQKKPLTFESFPLPLPDRASLYLRRVLFYCKTMLYFSNSKHLPKKDKDKDK